MVSSMVLVIAALGAAAVLVVQMPRQLWPIAAAVAAGLEAAIRFGILRLSIKGLDLWLVLGVALLAAGAMCWMKASSKLTITAATVLTAVGAVQVLSSF